MVAGEALKGYNDVIILRVLLDGDSYGYEIANRIRRMAQERYSIKQTTLYSALNRLARLEYVMPYDGVESFGRPRMYYKVTEKGKAYYLSQKALWFEVVDIMDCFVRGESDEDD